MAAPQQFYGLQDSQVQVGRPPQQAVRRLLPQPQLPSPGVQPRVSADRATPPPPASSARPSAGSHAEHAGVQVPGGPILPAGGGLWGVPFIAVVTAASGFAGEGVDRACGLPPRGQGQAASGAGRDPT